MGGGVKLEVPSSRTTSPSFPNPKACFFPVDECLKWHNVFSLPTPPWSRYVFIRVFKGRREAWGDKTRRLGCSSSSNGRQGGAEFLTLRLGGCGFDFPAGSDQRLLKWYSLPPCLALSIQEFGLWGVGSTNESQAAANGSLRSKGQMRTTDFTYLGAVFPIILELRKN